MSWRDRWAAMANSPPPSSSGTQGPKGDKGDKGDPGNVDTSGFTLVSPNNTSFLITVTDDGTLDVSPV